jgi:hypothetical protein
MEEHFLTICRTNEPKSAVADDSLNCALHRHLDLRRGPLVAGQSTLPVKSPLAHVRATLPARKFFVKGMRIRKAEGWTICHIESPALTGLPIGTISPRLPDPRRYRKPCSGG